MQLNYIKILIITTCSILSLLSQSTYAEENIAASVSNELNQLYQRTTPCDKNEPAYYCSGIIIHGRLPDDDDLQPRWYLPADSNVGSFSYLRADITPQIGEPVYTNTGFILTPIEELAEKNEFSYKLYCEYPGDGASVGNIDSSCHFEPNDYLTVCRDEIKTVNDFTNKYLLNNPSHLTWEQLDGVCSFLPDKDRFDLAMQIHKFIYKNNSDKTYCKDRTFCRVHNELIIGTWDINSVPDINVPILAFFAVINDTSNPMFAKSGLTSTSDAEIERLFQDADAYSKATNYARQIPVITLDMSKLRKGAKDIFAPAVRPNIKFDKINTTESK